MTDTPLPEDRNILAAQQPLLNILDTVAEGIYCVNLQGQCTYCNASCLKLLRFDHQQELLGRNMHDLIHHTRRDGITYPVSECKIFQAYLNDRQVHVDDEVFFRKDGTRFDAEYWSYSLKEDGHITGAVVSFVDISVRRQEAAYRSYLARLVESSNDAIFSKDINGRITSWNYGATRIYGYDPEEAIGQTAAELILPPGRSEEEPEIQRAVREGSELRQFDVKRRRKNGEICDISLTISPIFNADGEHIGSSFVERDNTERRRSRDELLKAKTAAEHAETLANAANRSRAEFLATVSHELRTPMNAILGMLQLTLDEKLDPTLRDYLKTARASADSLLQLVNELLDFSKIESGKFEIAHLPFKLRETVDSAAKALAARASEKDLEILCEIDPDIPATVIGDGLRLQQVITNLLSNAIKFTDSGEVMVRVAWVRRLPDEVRLSFSVTDTGIGIRPEDRERIFSPFAQADMSLTRQQQGTGLGLSICRELLSLMGGTLKLESEVGKGSRFCFELTLPVVEQSTPSDKLPAGWVDNLKVLVVDDNASNLRILEKILVSWSMQPIVAESVEQALRILDEVESGGDDISLAIVDAMMPGVDGFTFAEKVALREQSGKPPVVIMQSAADLAVFADRKTNAPIANYLTKPVCQSELLDTVVDTLQLYDGPTTMQLDPASEQNQLLRPLTVLVAEDLPANRKVVQAILEKRGHHVMIAPNGQVTVDLVRSHFETLDVVLMDVQMPVMDGFQATTAIRGLNEPRACEIPIVAMTAHAMQGDREVCLAGGMDAYIAKPLDAGQLVNLVEAIVHSPGTVRELEDHVGEASAATIPPTSTESELHLLELDSAVNRLGGDQELFREFAAIFMQDAPALLDQIETSIDNGNHEQLAKSAHALKGLMMNFGARPCVQLALQFEHAGRERRTESMAAQLQQLGQLYEQLRKELAPFVK